MTSLRALLAFNMKEQRHVLGLSQAKLAEKINTSTHYIGMIELERKFPSPEMLERIAAALDMDSPDLFSIRAYPAEASNSIQSLRKQVMSDIEQILAYRMKNLETEAQKASALENSGTKTEQI
jgi:transcriptional regulator with XRE-family HTH domain